MVWCRKRIFDNFRFDIKNTIKLWFGVEKGYLTTRPSILNIILQLWFGVEKGYLTTGLVAITDFTKLWFGVEKGYLTTHVGT